MSVRARAFARGRSTATRLARAVDFVIAFALIAGCVLVAGCIIWTVATNIFRPPDYAEACLLFSASRIRSGLPLYVDPILGATEYGLPPTRFFVPYTPLYASLLALLPERHAMSIGRIASVITWFGALAVQVAVARRECRRQSACAAVFVASVFLFAWWATCARPDVFALLLAGVALARSIRGGRADVWSGALFAAAWVLKPSVCGIALGAIAATVLLPGPMSKRDRFGPVVSSAFVLSLALGAMMVVSGGSALHHLRAAHAFAFDAGMLVEHAVERLPFVVGLFLAAAFAAAQAPSPKRQVALAALLSSSVVSTLALGKLGSMVNYLMEPAIASVVILSQLRLVTPKAVANRIVLAGAVLLSALWSGVATFRSLLEERIVRHDEGRAIAEARALCLDRPSAVVVSTRPGIELSLNGRIYTHPLELWLESLHGRFPEDLWAADMASPNVRCVVTWTGVERPSEAPEGLFPPSVLRVMRERFVLEGVHSGYAIYVTRATRSP